MLSLAPETCLPRWARCPISWLGNQGEFVFSVGRATMYSMPGSWSERQIRRMLGADVHHPLATTRTHVAWENPDLRLEHNLVRNLTTEQDGFAVRITPAVDPYYAAVVIPLSPGGRFHLVARYRYAIARWSIEFPRFDFDSSDDGWKDAAEADLLSVTGLSPKRMNLLGAVQVDPALVSTSTMVVVARGCIRARSKAPTARPAEVEEASGQGDPLIAGSLVVSPAELSALVARGEIVCGVSLAALSLYRAWLE